MPLAKRTGCSPHRPGGSFAVLRTRVQRALITSSPPGGLVESAAVSQWHISPEVVDGTKVCIGGYQPASKPIRAFGLGNVLEPAISHNRRLLFLSGRGNNRVTTPPNRPAFYGFPLPNRLCTALLMFPGNRLRHRTRLHRGLRNNDNVQAVLGSVSSRAERDNSDPLPGSSDSSRNP